MSQQFINRTINGSIPKPFNSKTFKASVLQSDVLNAQSMNVSNKSTTNGIDDYAMIDAEDLVIQKSCNFYGTVIPNSNCVATTNFIKNQIDNLLGPNVSTALDSLAEINQAINNDPDFSNTVMNRMIVNEGKVSTNTSNIATLQTTTNGLQTSVTNLQTTQTLHGTNISNLNTSVGTISTQITTLQNGKADKNNPTFTGAATFNSITTQSLVDNGNLTIKGNTNIGDAAGDTLTVKGTTKFNNQVILSDDTNLGVRLGGYDSSISSINSTLSLKANDSSVVHLTGNETITGTKTFATLKLGLNDVATTNDISTAISNLVGTAPAALDTIQELSLQLQSDQNSINTILSSMVTLTGSQSISGSKTFTTSPVVPNLSQGNNSTLVANTSYVDSAITNLSSVYQPQNLMSDYLTNVTASTTYQPVSGMTNYLTVSNATSTYQPISSMSTYPRLSTSNTFTSSNEFSSELVSNKFIEKYTTATVSSNSLSINISTSTSNIFSISPSSGTNISLIVTNVPTNRTAIYSLTFYINTTTNKNYINSLNVNGSNVTMVAMGGLSNVSVNASSNVTIQNIFIQMNNATVQSEKKHVGHWRFSPRALGYTPSLSSVAHPGVPLNTPLYLSYTPHLLLLPPLTKYFVPKFQNISLI